MMVFEKVKKYLSVPLLVLLALLLRLWHIGSTDIGQDEAFSAMTALFPIDDIIHILTKGDNPPLWEILLHYWVSWFGVSLVAMRVLPLIFNVLTIIPIYLTGTRFLSSEAQELSGKGAHYAGWYSGLFAALFFIFGNFALFLSHEVRVYSLIGFLAAWSLYFFVGLLYRPDRRRFYLIGLTVVNILLMYGHYLAIWVIVVQVLLWLAVPRCRKTFGMGYLWHLSALALAYGPMYPVLWSRFLDSGLHGTWIPRAENVGDLLKLPYGFLNQNVYLCAFVCLMWGGYIVWMIGRIRKRAYRFGLFEILTCMWAIPLVVSFLLSFRVGFLLDRYFYFVLPPLYLSLAWLGLMLGRWMTEKSVLPGVLCQMVVLGLMGMNFHADSAYLQYDHYDTREASQRLYQYSEHQEANVFVKPNVRARREEWNLFQFPSRSRTSLKNRADAKPACASAEARKCALKGKFILTPFWIAPKLVYNFDNMHEIFRTHCQVVERNGDYSGYLRSRCIYNDDFNKFDFSGDTWISVFHYKNFDPVHLTKDILRQGFEFYYAEDLNAMRMDVYRKRDLP